MTQYVALFIDAEGVEDDEQRVEFEYDVRGHESSSYVLPEFLISLALDSPALSMAAIQTHVEGYLEQTVREGWLIVVNADGHALGQLPNRYPGLVRRSLSHGSPLCGPAVVVRESTPGGSASSSPLTDSTPGDIA